MMSPEIKLKKIEDQDRLREAQRGNIVLINPLNTFSVGGRIARVSKPPYDPDLVSSRQTYMGLVYRISDVTIIDGTVQLAKSSLRNGILEAYFDRYGVSRKDQSIDFNELDAFLREARL